MSIGASGRGPVKPPGRSSIDPRDGRAAGRPHRLAVEDRPGFVENRDRSAARVQYQGWERRGGAIGPAPIEGSATNGPEARVGRLAAGPPALRTRQPGGPRRGRAARAVRRRAGRGAFEAIVRRHGPMVLGVCRRLLGDRHLADDAFQATFLVLARRAGFDPRRRPAGPLALRGRLPGRPPGSGRRSGVAAPARSRPGSTRRRRPRCRPSSGRRPSRSLDDEIARLPEFQRPPLVLCYLSGLTIDQAADRLGIPVGTARSRLARARDRLRERLARRGVESQTALLGPITAAWCGRPAPPLSLVRRAVTDRDRPRFGEGGRGRGGLGQCPRLVPGSTTNHDSLQVVGDRRRPAAGLHARRRLRMGRPRAAPAGTRRRRRDRRRGGLRRGGRRRADRGPDRAGLHARRGRPPGTRPAPPRGRRPPRGRQRPRPRPRRSPGRGPRRRRETRRRRRARGAG